MSIAFKKNHFRVQIRRQNLNKILQHKRLQSFAHTQVNRTLLQYLHQYPHLQIPKICVLKYELIDQDHLHSFIDLLNSNSFKIDIKKASNIALLNKVFFSHQGLANKYFNQVTQFAEKILFAFPAPQENNTKQANEKGSQKLYIKPPANLMEDLTFLPNCLIEYWGNYFSTTDQNMVISMRAYCTIMRSFIKWFASKGAKHQNFSKYSVCFFLRNFFQSQTIYMPETYDKNELYKQIEEQFIRFRIVSMSVVLRLLEEQFYCQELIHLLEIITGNSVFSKDLLRALRENERDKDFFEMLLEGMNNENVLIFKDFSIKERFFYSEQLTQQNLKTLSELSVEKILKEDVSQSIWNCKIKMLDIFNHFLIMNHFSNLFYQSRVEEIVEKLFNIYFYSTEQGKNTIAVQKTLCLIFYNILLLSESQFDFEDEQDSCLKIQTADQSSIQQRLTDYFFQNVQKIQDIVSKTEYIAYNHIVEMISFLKQLSEFLYNKEVDQKIMDEGRLVMKICEAFQKEIFGVQEGRKIMDSLFEYLEQLSDRDFDFSFTFSDIETLKKTQFKAFLTSQQEDLLDEILKPFESQDPLI